MGFPAATNNRNIIFSICPDLFRSFVFHKSEVALISRSTALMSQISDRLWKHHIPLQLTRSSGSQSACCSDCFASESSPIKELPTSAPRLFVYSLLLTELFFVLLLFHFSSLGTFFFFLFFMFWTMQFAAVLNAWDGENISRRWLRGFRSWNRRVSEVNECDFIWFHCCLYTY